MIKIKGKGKPMDDGWMDRKDTNNMPIPSLRYVKLIRILYSALVGIQQSIMFGKCWFLHIATSFQFDILIIEEFF